jgi:hypothetical protein
MIWLTSCFISAIPCARLVQRTDLT